MRGRLAVHHCPHESLSLVSQAKTRRHIVNGFCHMRFPPCYNPNGLCYKVSSLSISLERIYVSIWIFWICCRVLFLVCCLNGRIRILYGRTKHTWILHAKFPSGSSARLCRSAQLSFRGCFFAWSVPVDFCPVNRAKTVTNFQIVFRVVLLVWCEKKRIWRVLWRHMGVSGGKPSDLTYDR